MGPDDSEIEALFQKINKMGFEGVEIPTFDGNLDSTRIRSLLSSSELVPIVIGGGSAETDLSSESALVQRNGQSYIKRLIDLCRNIGGDLVVGPLYGPVGEKRLLSESECSKAMASLAREFKDIGKYARDRSVRLALEPLCRYDTHLLNTVAQARKLIDEIDNENVGLLLDTFHLNIEEKSFQKAIELAGNKLFHFHACENNRGTPGSGLVNWQEVKKALDTLNYNGWIAIESFVPNRGQFSAAMNTWRSFQPTQDEIASDGLNYLKRLLAPER